MPSTYAHYRFGEDIKRQLYGREKLIIEKYQVDADKNNSHQPGRCPGKHPVYQPWKDNISLKRC